MSVDVTVLQTASGAFYTQLLRATSILNRTYCQSNEFRYIDYIGIKRGYYDWHSTYNRVFMLEELVEEGYSGWVLFLDADAFVQDLRFDLRRYIGMLPSNVAMVADRAKDGGKWDVNAGVFLVNLGHDVGRRIVNEWKVSVLRSLPDRVLRSAIEPWGALPLGPTVPNDQSLLHKMLAETPEFLEALHVEQGLFNYRSGRFVAQVLREGVPSRPERLATIRHACARALTAGGGVLQSDLTHLANRSGSDKGTTVGNAHGYTSLYGFLLEQYRYEKFNALEIGLLRGGPEAGGGLDRVGTAIPSIAMWLEYFPSARLFGIDISDFKKFQSERFVFHQLDLSDLDAALALRPKFPPLRVVIDDASHASYHQQVAFATFFPLVEPGGYYVMEDLDWQPKHMEEALPKTALTRDIFQKYSMFGNLDLEDRIAKIVKDEGHAEQISDVFIHRKSDGSGAQGVIKMIVLRKKG